MAWRRMMAGGLAAFLFMRLLPGFAIYWGKWISLPILNLLRILGGYFPFVLLECCAMLTCTFLIWSLFRKKFLKRMVTLTLGLLLAYLTIWYPLYFATQPVYAASPKNLARLCEMLIDELNASEMDFSGTGKLPAKITRSPAWMRALGVSGFCSFLTGEAIISPDLEPASLPFIAVHEQMHLQGIAGEGASNIAAWELCMKLGGNYAVSAQLWALRYAMGELRKTDRSFQNHRYFPDRSMTKLRLFTDQSLHSVSNTDRSLYSSYLQRMNSATFQAFNSIGGSYTPVPQPALLQALYSLLGIEKQTQDYEILAAYLAASLPE